MPARPHARRRAALALLVPGLLLGLAACSDDAPAAPAPAAAPTDALDARLELLAFEGGAVGVPQDWEEVPAQGTTLASYQQQGPDGAPVAQLDVLTSEVPEGSPADALDASAQSNRALQVRGLEQVDRAAVEAPGADSAFRTEAAYDLPDGSGARSLEQSTVGPEGLYVLVRYSAGEDDFDEDLATAVLDSIALDEAGA